MSNLKQLINYDFQLYHLIINLIMIVLCVNIREGLVYLTRVR